MKSLLLIIILCLLVFSIDPLTIDPTKFKLNGNFHLETGKVVTLNATDTLVITSETDSTINCTLNSRLADKVWYDLTVHAATLQSTHEIIGSSKNNKYVLEFK